jgi:hypothetical protein
MGLPDEDSVKHPSCLWQPRAIGRWMITVAFDNCGERIQECPRCVHWPWPRCIHFDISNDALRDPTSIHAARGDPRCVAFLVFCVQLFCILADQKLFCCNPQDHESEQRGCSLEVRRRFNVIYACGKSLSHKCNGKAGSTEESPTTQWSLKVLMARSGALR